jgi:UDP-N-acetylglucosamine 2-epimerase (non-hydrolysing)
MILLTYGTRPEYIKIKPLIEEMSKRGISFKTLSTGQHKDIAPNDADFNLNFKDYGGNRLDSVMKNCLSIPDEVFDGINYILVQGDTTSVVGLSLSALHRKIKIIHLEAGLRTYDYENPFPEENNRRIVSTLASVHLCPTEQNKENLLKENIVGDIHVVGNTVLDNLLPYKKECKYDNKVLVTMHRRENHNDLHLWFYTINELAKENPDLEFILPLHPNPNVQKCKKWLTHVNIIDPLTHDELINLLVKTKLVITDSGGIQEECSFFNKKCLVCRKITERPESVELSSFMVEGVWELKEIFYKHINEFKINIISPYGDGYTSKKICNILENNIHNI